MLYDSLTARQGMVEAKPLMGCEGVSREARAGHSEWTPSSQPCVRGEGTWTGVPGCLPRMTKMPWQRQLL